jgi:putative sterol carrier protein
VLSLAPERGSATGADQSVCFDLRHGRCRDGRAASAEDIARAPFHLRGEAGVWKRVLAGEQDAVMAIMMGKLVLVRGNVATLAGYVRAAKAMVAAAGAVELDWTRTTTP